MPQPPSDNESSPSESYVQDPLPDLELEFSAETDTLNAVGCDSAPEGEETFGQPLDVIRFRELDAKIKSIEHQLKEKKDLHKLRKKHSKHLFLLTVSWITVVWMVVLLQGFGQWFTPIPSSLIHIKFNLSDTVAVAFITSTTATVLGLYGIAAYWLFGKPKENGKPETSE